METYKLKFRGGEYSWHVVNAKNATEARKKFVKGTDVKPYNVLLKKIKK
jgi:hypothetical protein